MAMAFWQACGAVPVWCLVVCAVVCLSRISGRVSGASGNRIAQQRARRHPVAKPLD